MKDLGPLTVESERLVDGFRIRLGGNACAAELDELRPALVRALEAQGPVIIDGAGLGLVDGGLLGALSLLQGRLATRGRELRIEGLDAVHADIFQRMGLTGPQKTEASSFPAQPTFRKEYQNENLL